MTDTDLVSLLRIGDDALSNFAADRIEMLEGTLRGMIEAMAMGTVEVAAKYGPLAHPDEPLIDAAHKARAVLDDPYASRNAESARPSESRTMAPYIADIAEQCARLLEQRARFTTQAGANTLLDAAAAIRERQWVTTG